MLRTLMEKDYKHGVRREMKTLKKIQKEMLEIKKYYYSRSEEYLQQTHL